MICPLDVSKSFLLSWPATNVYWRIVGCLWQVCSLRCRYHTGTSSHRRTHPCPTMSSAVRSNGRCWSFVCGIQPLCCNSMSSDCRRFSSVVGFDRFTWSHLELRNAGASLGWQTCTWEAFQAGSFVAKFSHTHTHRVSVTCTSVSAA